MLDVGPDIRQQLIELGVDRVDAFFATHCHFDHFGGLPELDNIGRFTESEVKLYGSEAVKDYMEDVFSWTDVDFQVIEDRKEFSGLTVEAFAVEHNEYLPMQGFSVTEDNKKVVYIPDLKSLPDSEKYREADILFVDGMYLFKKHLEEGQDHAFGEELKQEIEKVRADKVVLLGISEHFNQMTLEEEMDATEHEIGLDFQEFRI